MKNKNKTEKIEVGENGRLYVVRGTRRYLKWTPQMEADVRRFYPDSSNEEMEEILGVNQAIIRNKAYQMGIHKSSEYLARLRKDQICAMSKMPKNYAHLYTPEHRAKMMEGVRRSVERRKHTDYTWHSCKRVYCVEDKTTYPSIKAFVLAKGFKYTSSIYSSMSRQKKWRGYTLVRI